MEVTKCPVCRAISAVNETEEGEMVRCAYCKTKYTLIQSRIYSIIPKGVRLSLNNNTDFHGLEVYVKELDNEYLMQVLKIITDELISRYKKGSSFQKR